MVSTRSVLSGFTLMTTSGVFTSNVFVFATFVAYMTVDFSRGTTMAGSSSGFSDACSGGAAAAVTFS